jgi:peptidyl-tRNA hydrolase
MSPAWPSTGGRAHAPLDDLLVVADGFALSFGRLRLRASGSAGDNGLRSIIGELDSQKFARLRVGIGEPSRAAVDRAERSMVPSGWISTHHRCGR